MPDRLDPSPLPLSLAARRAALGLSFAAVAALAACGGGGGDGDGGSVPAPPPPASGPVPAPPPPASGPVPAPPPPASGPAPAPGPTPAPPSGPGQGTGAVTANGTVTATIAAVPDFTPVTDATLKNFSVGITRLVGETYTWGQVLAANAGQQTLSLSTRGDTVLGVTLLSVRYVNSIPRTTMRSCTGGCNGITLSRAADGTVSVRFDATALTYRSAGSNDPAPVTDATAITGSLSGRVDGGYHVMTDLPQGATGTLVMDGASGPPSFAEVNYSAAIPVATRRDFPLIQLRLGGADLHLTRRTDGSVSVGWAAQTALTHFATAPASVITDTTDGYRIQLPATDLTGTGGLPPVRVSADVTVRKPAGRLTVSGAASGTLEPHALVLASANEVLNWNATGATQSGQPFAPNLQVDIRNGRLVRATLMWSTLGAGMQCDSTIPAHPVIPACGDTVRVSADGLTLSFTGLRLQGFLTALETVTLDGTLSGPGR